MAAAGGAAGGAEVAEGAEGEAPSGAATLLPPLTGHTGGTYGRLLALGFHNFAHSCAMKWATRPRRGSQHVMHTMMRYKI